MSGVIDLTYEPWRGNQAPTVSASKVCLFDLIRGMSVANAKNYEYTDRKGNLQGVLCDITITSNATAYGMLAGVANSWKTRNAIRRFHFEREAMFRRAGVRKSEMGKYGKTMRPFLDRCHSDDVGVETNFSYWDMATVQMLVSGRCPSSGQGEPSGLTTEPYTGGDWDRTTLVSADPDPAVNIGVVDSADQWSIHICDEHDTNEAPWGSVGMIQAYNEDRMEVVTPSAEETIVAGNPLALLTSQTVTGGDVAEIAEEQELEATPYDILDAGDSIRKIEYGQFRIIPHTDGVDKLTAQYTLKNVFLPAGYLLMEFTSGQIFPGSGSDDFISVRFDIHGVLDCKDWTEA